MKPMTQKPGLELELWHMMVVEKKW